MWPMAFLLLRLGRWAAGTGGGCSLVVRVVRWGRPVSSRRLIAAATPCCGCGHCLWPDDWSEVSRGGCDDSADAAAQLCWRACADSRACVNAWR